MPMTGNKEWQNDKFDFRHSYDFSPLSLMHARALSPALALFKLSKLQKHNYTTIVQKRGFQTAYPSPLLNGSNLYLYSSPTCPSHLSPFAPTPNHKSLKSIYSTPDSHPSISKCRIPLTTDLCCAVLSNSTMHAALGVFNKTRAIFCKP
ncbi:hypothetical protein ACMFMG_006909 [Clarireedia jacksonii]